MVAGKLKVIYVPAQFDEAWRQFEAIALRDKGKRGVSSLVNELVEQYAKKHTKGNSGFTLETFDNNPKVLAYPAIWEDPTPDKIHELSTEDAKFMVGQMSKWYPELQRKVKTG